MAFEELTSVEIHNVSDVISFVKEHATRIYDCNVHSISLYRGQANYNWQLTPNVYRNGQFKYESIYVKELERIRPLEFTNCDNFTKLVKMQHYGLPTRLLDVTLNPLVALYFACKNHLEQDGAFYYFSTPTFWEDYWAVRIIADFAVNHTYYMKKMVEREVVRSLGSTMKQEKIEEMIRHALGLPAHAVLPRTTNQRIQQQSGAFFIYGMSYMKPNLDRKADSHPEGYMPYCELDPDQEKNICPIIKKIRIPAEYKQEIMAELDLLNVNEGFLFPELEYQSKTVVQYVQKKIGVPKPEQGHVLA